MTQSEKLLVDAENEMKIIDGFRKEIDLRAGQIDKLRQEMDSYTNEIHKSQLKHDGIIKQAEQEQEKEAEEEKRRKQQQIMNAAQGLYNSNS